MKILVLGGYGLIGLSITKALLAAGHEVTGLGRSVRKGEAAAPDATWIGRDLSHMTEAEDWTHVLTGIDVVVNAAGVLQDGMNDRVMAVQRDAVRAMAAACNPAGVRQIVQISAPGVSESSDTVFYRSKAEGDAAVKASGVNWVIFRPGLVLSPQAYGGTALLRQLAAVPLLQPVMLADADIRTVHVDDVAASVVRAVAEALTGVDADLLTSEPTRLEDLILSIRSWLGFASPKAVIRAPYFLGAFTARLGDLAGWLGWRPALRTTSLKVLGKGVTGNADQWPVRRLSETLQALPSTVQERTYARTALLYPFLLLILSAFWIVSGIIGWAQQVPAMAVFGPDVPEGAAKAFVLGGAVADIAIGAALLIRPLTRPAALAAVLVSLAYLAGSAVLAPHLWADPLGPMVKVFPAIALSLTVWTLTEAR
ncbi:SDR family oxidoreductase [uncultured Hyphomonas sp.]|uniref:SDR family oxidoreductase n=1 Tax=uncultured Hyphomonas sp. TaxID=225298 RepID=UPI002AAA9411|nr:SDR family oxidoreductase [uncultured Hyphomonas sp.]